LKTKPPKLSGTAEGCTADGESPGTIAIIG
jgi:hypothetical protein